MTIKTTKQNRVVLKRIDSLCKEVIDYGPSYKNWQDASKSLDKLNQARVILARNYTSLPYRAAIKRRDLLAICDNIYTDIIQRQQLRYLAKKYS